MTTYVVLLPGDETAWAAATEDHRQSVFALHRQFSALLAERGLKVTGGAELAPSSEAKVLRTSADGTSTVTEGPYAETTEQLTGFYIIDSEDLDDLIDCCRVLAPGERAIEIRAFAGGS